MSKVEAKFERKGASIKNLETGQVQSFTRDFRERDGFDENRKPKYHTVTRPAVNAAKRESRKIQAGNLGSGLLRVA